VQDPLSKKLKELAHEHIIAVLTTFMFMGASAAGFYWTTQIDLVETVGANTARSETNTGVVLSIDDNLEKIKDDVADIRIDVAVIKQKVETLEKK
jgi:Kef-type K+ transport system membrane component KefB